MSNLHFKILAFSDIMRALRVCFDMPEQFTDIRFIISYDDHQTLLIDFDGSKHPRINGTQVFKFTYHPFLLPSEVYKSRGIIQSVLIIHKGSIIRVFDRFINSKYYSIL